jgi:hypothetical protein
LLAEASECREKRGPLKNRLWGTVLAGIWNWGRGEARFSGKKQRLGRLEVQLIYYPGRILNMRFF